jgi:HSP20 family protein
MQRQMDRWLGHGISGDPRRVGGGSYPPVNVLDGPEDIVVQCELAGVQREDIDLSVTGETLVVKGIKQPPAEAEKLRFHRRERGVGEFNRTIVLPDRIDADRVEAELNAGILTIRLPKSEAARPKQIRVK